jgi:chromosome segregation ATPase
LPQAPRTRLKNAWAQLGEDRVGLLSRAQSLDPVDHQLYGQYQALIGEGKVLDTRREALEQEIRRWEQQCDEGRKLPPDEYTTCLNRRTSLEQREDKYEADAAEYEKRVDAFNAKLRNLRTVSSNLLAAIRGWETSISRFTQSAKDELERAERTTVRFQAQGDDIGTPNGTKSVVADVIGALCEGAGEQKLSELKEALTSREVQNRDQAFLRAIAWERAVAASGGVRGPQPSKSFQNDAPNPRNARIDIEVLRGQAFVPCPAVSAPLQ